MHPLVAPVYAMPTWPTWGRREWGGGAGTSFGTHTLLPSVRCTLCGPLVCDATLSLVLPPPADVASFTVTTVSVRGPRL